MGKLKNGIEGLVIIGLGLFLLISSLNIKANPIQYEGWTNTFAQAKFVPTIMSAGIIVLGLMLLIKQLKGNDKSNALSKEELKRLVILLILMGGYIIAVFKMKFMIPTIVFSFAIMFFLNFGKRKIWMIVLLSLLAIAIGLKGLPLLINLRLPLM